MLLPTSFIKHHEQLLLRRRLRRLRSHGKRPRRFSNFQMYGYGGFGYDTSHIQPDEVVPEIFLKAQKGDLNGVMRIVECAAAISEKEKVKTINYARKWTEVDYKMSGFTKEWEWYDLTPVAIAATLGHHDVVEYLLQQGADPTLSGCPTEDVTVDAIGAAKKNLAFETKKDGNNDYQCNRAQRCVDLLLVANLFWEKAKYSRPHYGKRTRAVFSNRPNISLHLLQEALENVADIAEYPVNEYDLESIKNTYTDAARREEQESCRDSNETIDDKGRQSKVKARPEKKKKPLAWQKAAAANPLETSANIAPPFSFGQNTFGATPAARGIVAPTKQTAGTASVPYTTSIKEDGSNTIIMQSVTGMSHFEMKSFEELRLEDYAAANKGMKGRKTAAAPVFGQPAGGLFGSPAAAAPASIFGKPARGSFGAPAPAPAFSVGSSEKKKKKKSASTKSVSLNASNLFKSTEKDASDLPDPESTDKSPFTFTFESSEKCSFSSFPADGTTAAAAIPLFSFGSSEQKGADEKSRTIEKTSSPAFSFGNKSKSQSTFRQGPTLSAPGNQYSKTINSNLFKVNGNISTKLESAESAISFLESLSPNEILPHHVLRLEAILARSVKGANEKPSGAKINDNKTREGDMSSDLDSIRSAVLDDGNLLARILQFEGSLAISERAYSSLIGYENPKPFDEPIVHIRTYGTPVNALVCKKWKEFVIGSEGVDHWELSLEEERIQLMRLAEDVSKDEAMSWSARLLAMAIANDAGSLKTAFADKDDHTQGVGAAFEEAEHDEDYDIRLRSLEVKCDRDHAFYAYCISANQFDFDVLHYCGDTVDDWSKLFGCNLAYAAAENGSVEALAFLKELHGDDLWEEPFDEKGCHFLSRIVQFACDARHSAPRTAESVRCLLEGNSSSNNDELLHQRHYGCNGNNLHLAAARGHVSLVEALLDGGMDPSRPCTKICRGRSTDPRDRGVREFPLPVDWAEVRGHTEVVELLSRHRSLNRPDLRTPGMRYQKGKLSTFFPAEERQYGFIEPGGIFVHLSRLRIMSEDDDKYPAPGQMLCFTTTTDRRGRKRADEILDGNDFSYLRLPLTRWDEPEMQWDKYNYNGTEDSEDEDYEYDYY